MGGKDFKFSWGLINFDVEPPSVKLKQLDILWDTLESSGIAGKYRSGSSNNMRAHKNKLLKLCDNKLAIMLPRE